MFLLPIKDVLKPASIVNFFESSTIALSAARPAPVVIPASPPTFLNTLILEDLSSLLRTLIFSGRLLNPPGSPTSNTSFMSTQLKSPLVLK